MCTWGIVGFVGCIIFETASDCGIFIVSHYLHSIIYIAHLTANTVEEKYTNDNTLSAWCIYQVVFLFQILQYYYYYHYYYYNYNLIFFQLLHLGVVPQQIICLQLILSLLYCYYRDVLDVRPGRQLCLYSLEV